MRAAASMLNDDAREGNHERDATRLPLTLGVLAAHRSASSRTSAPAFAADEALIAAAKKEGQVTWYTTQIITQFGRPADGSLPEEIRHQGECRARRFRRAGGALAERSQSRPHAGRCVRRHHDIGLPQEGRHRAEMAAGRDQAIAAGILGPRRLLGRQQRLRPHARLQYQSRPGGHRAEEPGRTSSTRNGRARWPGPRTRPRPARPDLSAWC